MLVAVFYQESAGWAFLITVLITSILGSFLRFHGKIQGKVTVREGFAAVGGAWVLASLFGALPYLLSGEIPSYIDAVFETASGLTTTGASVLSDLENFRKAFALEKFNSWWAEWVLLYFFVLLPNIGMGAVHFLMRKYRVPFPKKCCPD
jgi:trk system potassium uptake protein TrkH